MNTTTSGIEARYYGDHPDFFEGEYVSLTIYADDDELYPDEWIIFPRQGGAGVEVDPIDIYILEG